MEGQELSGTQQKAGCPHKYLVQKTNMGTQDRDISIEGIARDSSLALGQYGAFYEVGTTLISGAFGCITAVEDSVFTSLAASNWEGDSTASLPLKAGMSIFGSFTSFQLSTGKVIAYRDR